MNLLGVLHAYRQPNAPKCLGNLCTLRLLVSCIEPRTLNPRACLFQHLSIYVEGVVLRKVEVSLSREYQHSRFDALHCSLEVAEIWGLIGTVTSLPGIKHGQKVIGI